MQDSLLDWGKVILEKNIDALIYPEIGMHQLTTQLANLRLAPIQIAAWGHPETSGIPTIDYYLSARFFESDNSQSAYTENLIELPNLGCTYTRLSIISNNLNLLQWGIDASVPILLCPGSPFKYMPEYDWVLVEIVKRLGKCKLIFFNQQERWTKILRERLEKVFHNAGLDLDDYVVFIPWLNSEDFYGLMEQATVYLDTIGFSGFNTAMQALDCALPTVSKEGKFMRGRLCTGILRRIGIPELIANTDEEYIRLVVQLVKDADYRHQIRNKIIEKRNILYGDIEPTRALESFLMESCREL
jgi:predicted O-linked N-acetylglucosamine transferase (SPINDLY family)